MCFPIAQIPMQSHQLHQQVLNSKESPGNQRKETSFHSKGSYVMRHNSRMILDFNLTISVYPKVILLRKRVKSQEFPSQNYSFIFVFMDAHPSDQASTLQSTGKRSPTRNSTSDQPVMCFSLEISKFWLQFPFTKPQKLMTHSVLMASARG